MLDGLWRSVTNGEIAHKSTPLTLSLTLTLSLALALALALTLALTPTRQP